MEAQEQQAWGGMMTGENVDTDDKEPNVLAWGTVAAVLCMGALALMIWYAKKYWQFHNDDGIAAVGSVASALFSALAFVGVIATILLQRHELKLQRRELAATTAEFEKQNRTMALDQFERNFFQLLRMNRAAAEEQVTDKLGNPRVGSEAFLQMANRLPQQLPLTGRQPTDAILDEVGSWYERECLVQGSDFGRYFRTLFHALSYIDKDDRISDPERLHYARILRSQLSTGEVALLIANCHSQAGAALKPLALKYRLAKVAVLPSFVTQNPGLFDLWLEKNP
jgi:hypothetical protein